MSDKRFTCCSRKRIHLKMNVKRKSWTTLPHMCTTIYDHLMLLQRLTFHFNFLIKMLIYLRASNNKASKPTHLTWWHKGKVYIPLLMIKQPLLSKVIHRSNGWIRNFNKTSSVCLYRKQIKTETFYIDTVYENKKDIKFHGWFFSPLSSLRNYFKSCNKHHKQHHFENRVSGIWNSSTSYTLATWEKHSEGTSWCVTTKKINFDKIKNSMKLNL